MLPSCCSASHPFPFSRPLSFSELRVWTQGYLLHPLSLVRLHLPLIYFFFLRARGCSSSLLSISARLDFKLLDRFLLDQETVEGTLRFGIYLLNTLCFFFPLPFGFDLSTILA